MGDNSSGLWRVWPGPGWPATRSGESALIFGLIQMGGKTVRKSSTIDRDDVTLLINALRCNLTAQELMKFAPGIKPLAVVAVYEKLNRLLLRAQRDAIVMLSTPGSSPKFSQELIIAGSILLPVPATRITTAHELESSEGAEAVRIKIKETVERVQKHVDDVESWLDEHGSSSSSTGTIVGNLLYHPNRDCMWSSPFFLPSRVGQLNSRRLSRLIEGKV